jgi:hypothetical protein
MSLINEMLVVNILVVLWECGKEGPQWQRNTQTLKSEFY